MGGAAFFDAGGGRSAEKRGGPHRCRGLGRARGERGAAARARGWTTRRLGEAEAGDIFSLVRWGISWRELEPASLRRPGSSAAGARVADATRLREARAALSFSSRLPSVCPVAILAQVLLAAIAVCVFHSWRRLHLRRAVDLRMRCRTRLKLLSALASRSSKSERRSKCA